MDSRTDEELAQAWQLLIEKYEEVSKILIPNLQKFSNLEKEREALQLEFMRRGVVIDEKKEP